MQKKIGIALIGPSGVGKTTIGKILAQKLGMGFHDIDDEGLEGAWGEGGVARVLSEFGDDGFLERENMFISQHYGPKSEGYQHSLDDMIIATPGSIVLEDDAMMQIQKHMIIIYLDLDIHEISRRAQERGVSRIVGMNGDTPRFSSLEEVMRYRKEYYEKYAELTCHMQVGNTPEQDAVHVYDFITRYIQAGYQTPSLLQDSRSEKQLSLRNAIITSQPYSGGLWCPKYFSKLDSDVLQSFEGGRYQELAKYVLGSWSFGVSKQSLDDIIEAAYGAQWYRRDITPVTHITNNLYSLHLGYGPTFAFKNIALEFLPRVLCTMCPDKKIHVLGASSGDTINAAHSGVKGTNIYSLFMLPSSGPSAVQRLQAEFGITQNPNAHTLLANAPFDPLQDIVKRINSEEFRVFKDKYNITSFNSINIARILAQSVYYFRAYLELIAMKKISFGQKVIYGVPSGNFGDALAGYYAYKMGLPVEKIHIATNENDMLDVFLATGRYEPPKKGGKDYVEVTNSPSMDIAKSSNFERMLFDITDGDNERIALWYKDLSEQGFFEVGEDILCKIQALFSSSRSTNEERLDAIRTCANEYHHGIDPHTAAALVPYFQSKIGSDIPYIFLETSHIAQFSYELEQEGINAPGMHDFDTVLESMKQAGTGSNTTHTGDTFETIFPDIQEALNSFE